MNKTIIFALVVIISCGGSDVLIEESAINTETTTTTTIQSTTTTISKNKDEFYTTGGVVTFTNEEIKDTFSEFFELKTKDCIYLVKVSKAEGIHIKPLAVDDLDIDFEEE